MRLTEEQTLIRETARAFAQEQLAPKGAEWDGAGAGHVAYALAMIEVAAGDGACSTIMSVHNSVTCMPILRYGTTEQKERFLRPLARGEILGAFCLTEPQAGSDAAALETRAEKVGNHYVLNGVKQFITSGENADIAIAFAVTDPAAGKKGISAFIVPTDTPGYRVAGVEKKLGQRASDTCQIIFEDLKLTPDLLLGEEGEGYKIALANLEGGRIGVASQAVGMARAAYEAAVAYAKERKSFGRPIIEHQAVAFRLADMATRIRAAELMALDAAALRDSGKPCLKEAAMAKLFASEMAERVCSDAIQVHGGYGYVADFPVERIYRDVRVCQIYEGTSDVQRLVISRQIAAD
jgi:alkylation response protein AidB-like acyl-CoA dehydrogenase